MKDLAKEEGSVLGPFFGRLESGFGGSPDEYRFCVEAGGKKLLLCFRSREQADVAERCFAVLPEVPDPDARFCFWTDDCSRYTGPDAPSERWRYRSEGGSIISAPGSWLVGTDIPGRTFYYVRHDPFRQAQVPVWALSYLVTLWAGTAGLIVVHGAAVGADGRGVLLAARSGGGKSTLAASCLLSGMDYVADDYVLVNAEGPLRAMPIFSTLAVNPDTKERLDIDLPVIWEYPAWGGKRLLDISSFPICGGLAVRAVVFLSRWDRGPAEIVPVSGHRAPGQNSAVRQAQSLLQHWVAYDPPMAKATVQRFSGLPAWEMRLGADLKQNADALRAFIDRME